jgi:Domain of unknown function (DUF1857)
MIDVDRSVAVNSTLEPGDPILATPDIWTGLVMKAEDPVPFVKPINQSGGRRVHVIDPGDAA